MDTNILAASFAGGMIGGLTGAYIASRSYKKEVIKGLDEKSSSPFFFFYCLFLQHISPFICFKSG